MMKKAVLISIRPKWCELIAAGNKTVEVRKTRPKIDPPFKVYIYCSKGKERLLDILRDGDDNFGETYHGKDVFITCPESSFYYGHHGKVIGEFVCDWIKDFGFSPYNHGGYNGIEMLHEKSCVGFDEMYQYIGESFGFGWHISDLQIYDSPMELSMYYRDYAPNGMPIKHLQKAPESWCYVEEQL